jgi:5-carboxymethyl-2-hydroxymuconate isomerase
MPLVNIDYTANIQQVDFLSLLPKIHAFIVDICEAKLLACKGKVSKIDNYAMGHQVKPVKQAYIVVQIRLLPGRSTAQKDRLAKAIFDLLKSALLAQLIEQQLICEPRVEVSDLDDYYFSPWKSE